MNAPILQGRVLIIDDDDMFAAALKRHLESAFSDVDWAAGEAQAWALLDAHRYDVIFLDLMLDQEAAGLGICRALRTSPKWKDVPVFIVTSADMRYGMSLKSYLGDRQCLPADDFLDKCMDLAEMVKQARRAVERPDRKGERGQ